MLHEGNPGVTRMKRFARGYVWWPGIDKELEFAVRTCGECRGSSRSNYLVAILVARLLFMFRSCRLDCPEGGRARARALRRYIRTYTRDGVLHVIRRVDETVGIMGTRDTEEAGRGGAEENREGTEEG